MKTLTVRNYTIGESLPGIIVPVMEKTKEATLRAAGEAVSSAADILELRADAYEDLAVGGALTALLKKIRPVIGMMTLLVTVRTAEEGGLADLSQTDYETIVSEAIASGEADLIDIEYRRATPSIMEAAKAARVPVVLSSHNFLETPTEEDMKKLLAAMSRTGADLLKIAVMAHTASDADRLMAVSKDMAFDLPIPLITIAMGEEGIITRIAGERDGSVLTFAACGNESAPGQLESRLTRKLLYGVHRLRQAGRLLYLTGFMGSGKTAAARELGRITGQYVFEMDSLIEEAAGRTIPEIFESEGEDGFRQRETDCLKSIMFEKGCIVSCGGGIVTRPENINLMRRSGDIVLLNASPETIMERIETVSQTRPLLSGSDAAERFMDLYEQRRETYHKCANIVVETDGMTVSEVAREIILMVENTSELG